MQDPPRRQVSGTRRHRVSGLERTEPSTELVQLAHDRRPADPMDSPINPAAPAQLRICGVSDHVGGHLRDIARLQCKRRIANRKLEGVCVHREISSRARGRPLKCLTLVHSHARANGPLRQAPEEVARVLRRLPSIANSGSGSTTNVSKIAWAPMGRAPQDDHQRVPPESRDAAGSGTDHQADGGVFLRRGRSSTARIRGPWFMRRTGLPLLFVLGAWDRRHGVHVAGRDPEFRPLPRPSRLQATRACSRLSEACLVKICA